MKYLLVKEISIAREDQWQAGAFPGEGVYKTQLRDDPVVVCGGKVWTLPAGAKHLIQDGEIDDNADWARKMVRGEFEGAVKTDLTPDTELRRWAMETAVATEDREDMNGGKIGLFETADSILKWVLRL